MSPHSLALQAATEDDLPFLLSLRKATMTEHLARAGAPQDDAHHLTRIRYHFDDAQIAWLHDSPAGRVAEGLEQAGRAAASTAFDLDLPAPSRGREEVLFSSRRRHTGS